MYGLEVDSWTAVEPVSAVSSNSSCENFFEPKRMSRVTHTHTKTSQSGRPKAFAHVNKFSILAPDDNEFTGECCTFNAHVKGFSVNKGDTVMNELINALQPLRQKFPATNEDPAHRS